MAEDDGGHGGHGPASEEERLRRALQWEQELVGHWRDLADERGRALTALRRRFPVRVLLAIDRLTRRGATRRRAAERLSAGSAALATRVARPPAPQPTTPAPPPDSRRVSVVVFGRTVPDAIGDAPDVVVVDADAPSADRAAALAATTGDLVCLLRDGVTPLTDAWLGRLAAEVRDDVAAAGPQIVRPWSRRRSTRGLTFDRAGGRMPVLRPITAATTAGGPAEPVPVLPAVCVLVDRAAADAAGGLGDGDVVDLCWRLGPKRRVVVVPEAVALDGRDGQARAGDCRVGGLADRHGPEVARAVEVDRLTGARQLSQAACRAIVDARADPVLAQTVSRDLAGLGWDVVDAGADSPDVVIALDPTAAMTDTGGGTKVAWATRDLDVWLGTDCLREYDVVVVSDDAAAATVSDSSGHRAVLSGAAQLRDALLERAARPAFALDIAPPDRRIAPRWGDTHLAGALARALRLRGHHTRVQTADEWDSLDGRAYDVAVQLKGFGRRRRTPGRVQVVWNISHPEELTPEECDDADLVLVASERFADHLRATTSTPVGVLLQATDHRRFKPAPPSPRFRHDVAFVGKSRDVFRPVVRDALAVGLRPAVYGTAWQQFIDPALIAADYVPNEELPLLYSSIDVLLNDHWDWMREWGFVSNRLFDALACGTAVVSDHLDEIPALFGEAVTTYRTPDELRARVDELLASDSERSRRAGLGRDAVLAGHTFDVRVDELVRAVEPFLRGPPASSAC